MNGWMVVIHDTVIYKTFEHPRDAHEFVEAARRTVEAYKNNPNEIYAQEDTYENRLGLAEYEVHQGRVDD